MFGKKQIMSVLLVMGLIALGLIWTAGCSKNSTGFQPILVDLQESQWTSNTNGDSGIIEVFLQGDGVEKIILDSIAMKGDKPGVSPLKASSAIFQDKRIRAEFSKSEALNLLSNPTRGSKHFISIVYMVVDSADSEEVNTEVVLDEGNPTALTLEIAPAEWDLNFSTKSGDVKAFIRGEGLEKIDLTSLVMKGDNTTALPLPAQSAILQGNHIRAEFPKNQVLNLLLNPTEGSVHAIVLNFLETGGTVPIELTVQIIVTDEDEGEEPGVLSLEVDPAEWDLNYINSSGKVETFIRGEGIEKIDLTTIRMKGDNTTAEPMVPESVSLNGDHIRAAFPKNQVLNLLSNPTEGSVHTIVVSFLEIGGTVPIELTAQITITDEDGDDEEEPGPLTLQVSPADWNLNYSKSSGTVSAFLRGEGIEKIVLTSIQLKGDNTAALPLASLTATLNGDHVRATFPKNQVLGLLLNPISGSVHTVTVSFESEGGLLELTAVVTVTGKSE
jgi:hypothetical protein